MSKQSDIKERNMQLIEDFVNSWAKMSADNPDITVGEWLKSFAIMTGLAMKMADMSDEIVEQALDDMAELTFHVFDEAETKLVRSTLQ
jgi:uncharacterized protein YgfB (UPF0149 family)